MKASSNRQINYSCTQCGRDVGKENLKVKRVQFCDMGSNGRVEKTRVTDWLCMIPQTDGTESCLMLDPSYSQVAHFAAPGLRDVS